ncbi:helix-turn-helix domain-containing protein [Filimonas effusa]|uniref:AraC family transcriptional regulator n=1 Tax=Filimonas effusa TaxID=2508721 RepID=A0A4Q1D5I8_9BACT|nr:AraC family transcriptional regulator [Filimonas effusa]RXK83236.1 AraC family transcriptional regulator [Filimonas effusa]
MKEELLREIIPLTPSDCFTIFSRIKSEFDFPLHHHEEFELNFIRNARGAQRVIGNHIEEIGDLELVLVGPNLQHGWFTHRCKSRKIEEITVQFHRDLFPERFLHRNQMSALRTMFERSLRGILFPAKATTALMPRLKALTQAQGFPSVLDLLTLLHELSVVKPITILSDIAFTPKESIAYNSRRIHRVMEFINGNFQKTASLEDAAAIAGMAPVSFSRFFKTRTGKTYIDTLNEIRVGNASRMLIDTTQSIAEIASRCGFNNLSNFNRIFKKKKICTPKEFRETFNASGVRTFI